MNPLLAIADEIYLGKDWQRLVDIKNKYPVDIASKKRSHSQLMAFKRDVQHWLSHVALKIKLSRLSPDRENLLTQTVESINKFVLPRIEQNGLHIFHQIIKDTQSSPQTMIQYHRANFIGRYLKPEFAQNYKDQKIEFYQDLQNNILHEIQTVKTLPDNTQRLQALHIELAFVVQRLNKWTQMPIMANMSPVRVFPLDEVMGIQNMKDLKYRGTGIVAAVIEPREGKNSFQAHSSFKDRVSADSDVFSKTHGTHVTGIVAARAETILDREGIAPDVKIYYAPIKLTGGTTIEYADPPHPKTKESSIVSGSLPNENNDIEMAKILNSIIAKHIHIINMSMVYSVGPRTYLALKQFAHEGGTIVKAAGNSGVTIESKIDLRKYKLNKTQKNQISIDTGLYNTIMGDPELKNAFLIVGNLNSATTLAKSSNRAGFTADRYIAAWGDNISSTVGHNHRAVLSGTSMAAPMVTGSLALLVQAFPNCGPQNLAHNLLESATPLGSTKEFGRGRLNLTRAYQLSEQTCGIATPPPAAMQ